MKAIDIQTGKVRWKYTFAGNQDLVNHTGVMTTAGGLVFAAAATGSLSRSVPGTARPFGTSIPAAPFDRSPMSFMAGGKQYIALFGKTVVFTLALID